MPKARKNKRKLPVTQTGSASDSTPSGSSSNPSATRTLIRRFHVLLKRKTQLQHVLKVGQRSGDVSGSRKELAEVEKEIEGLGGLAAYQRMSSIGQGNDRGGGSEKVLVEWLKQLGLPESARKAKKQYKLLEVGALKSDNYAPWNAWINVMPIDLHSRHPSILEQDFLLMDEKEHYEKWDIISLSLVLNFVPDAKDRGRMLLLAHAMLRPDGLLFLALPFPCINNSRYLTAEHLDGLIGVMGFQEIQRRWKEGGKMAYWLFRKSSVNNRDFALYEKKVVLRQGDRNNFAVLL
ncbi:25S rRNA adenine-N(1) methyltransferase [Grifola frondosa]|uniref:25S rRNA adenine-N(1) methyltransferase n=1 Tax=Grifola frondosa TaxID=5627 RepID=A0A1C7MFF4_GRIFR|nr:25S rRNA adenine-N(1) methyltransferase [Grifola frondosa]